MSSLNEFCEDLTFDPFYLAKLSKKTNSSLLIQEYGGRLARTSKRRQVMDSNQSNRGQTVLASNICVFLQEKTPTMFLQYDNLVFYRSILLQQSVGIVEKKRPLYYIVVLDLNIESLAVTLLRRRSAQKQAPRPHSRRKKATLTASVRLF